jgi:hypothetical protein
MLERVSSHTLWSIALLLSLAATLLIGTIWAQSGRDYSLHSQIVRNAAELNKQLASKDTIEVRDGIKPYLVPTGLFIQSLAFNSASDVNITGYIWQKYPSDFPEGFSRRVVFPEEVNSSSTLLREEYRIPAQVHGTDHELIGWYFDVTVRQSFDYSHYPLDHLSVWLRVWPGDFSHDNQIILIPDFTAYADTSGKRFGLDREIVQGEWEIDETFFSFNNIPYDTNFGDFRLTTRTTYKELFFNLGMQRQFINAFIINLVPLLVVALLLFASLMTISWDDQRASRFGFSTSGILGTCSALFFVVLLAHIQVRSQFAGSGLVYIEYFYLIMYGAILLTALNAYVFSLGREHGWRWLHMHDNLIPKVVFWPLLMWALAITTWLKL